VAAIVLLATLATTANNFVALDDGHYLTNPHITVGLTPASIAFAFTSVTDLYWHPLAWLSHALDFQLYARDPAGQHFTSLLLHALTAGLLFLVLKRLGARAWLAAASSLLWALHPLRVESFAWVAERKDVLCAFFFTATVLAYLHYAARPSGRRYTLWLALAAMALMSKPTAVSLPVILLLLDYWPLQRTRGIPHLLGEKLPLFAMAAAVMGLTVYGQKVSGSMSHLAEVPFWTRLANVPIAYLRYLGKILWPLSLACFYLYDKHPAAVWVTLSALAFCAITALASWQRRRRPWLLVGWLWFVVALLPNIGLLQAGRQSIADRFTLLAMLGLVIAFAFSVSHWKTVTALPVCAAVVLCAGLTTRQIGFWHDSERLFEHAIAVADCDYTRGVLAATLLADRRYADAEPHLREAIRLAPERAEYHNNLANVLLKTGRIGQAAAEAAVALGLAPDDLSATETMGQVLFRQADYQGALDRFTRAVALGAEKAPVAAALNDMGASVASRGNPRDAEPLIRKALELNPSLPEARRNLALVLEDQVGTPPNLR
jgi:tetratricopeptide (TPR) repeat protein